MNGETKVIYVCAFSPDASHWLHKDTGRVGGFDWRATFEEAVGLLQDHLGDGDTGHDYVLRSIQVPRDLDRAGITEYLSGDGNYLIELPLPEEWVI